MNVFFVVVCRPGICSGILSFINGVATANDRQIHSFFVKEHEFGFHIHCVTMKILNAISF